VTKSQRVTASGDKEPITSQRKVTLVVRLHCLPSRLSCGSRFFGKLRLYHTSTSRMSIIRQEYCSPTRPLHVVHVAWRTKRSLVLVCKMWRRLCIPILYRSIAITSSRRSELLTATLTKSRDECSASDDTSARSLGSFTVRFHLTRSGVKSGDALLSIMRCLPNLSVLSAFRDVIHAQSLGIIDNILPCASSLRVIDWAGGDLKSLQFERLLENSPHLRMLRCGDIHLGGYFPLTRPVTDNGPLVLRLVQ
jgi:hypothetical protein